MTAQALLPNIHRYEHETISFLQEITPTEAADILWTMRYDRQRPVRQKKIQQYAAKMMSDQFELTTLFIAVFQGRYVLLDGQHRLSAVVLADRPQLFNIVEKEVVSSEELAQIYSRLDVGIRRTPIDIYRAHGLEHEFNLTKSQTARLGSAIKFMATGCLHTGSAELEHLVEIEYMRLYAPVMLQYTEIIESSRISNAHRMPAFRASTVAAALLTLRFSMPKAEREGRPSVRLFWEGALGDDGLKIGDPRKAAYRHLSETRLQVSDKAQSRQVVQAAHSLRALGNCFNAYIRRQELQYPKVYDKFGMVSIYGVPSDPTLWW